MKRTITNEDKEIINQNVIELRCRIEIYDEITGSLVDCVEGGLIDGKSSINADSTIRRTFDMTVSPLNQEKLKISQDGDIWLNKILKLKMGIKNLKTQEYVWWNQGFYVFKSATAKYDAVTNTISLSCVDLMAKLDGSKNGQIGDPIIKIDSAEKSPIWSSSVVYNTTDNKYCLRDYEHFICVNDQDIVGKDPIKENTEYNKLLSYDIGDVALHNDILYECIVKTTVNEEWTSSHWKTTTKHWDKTDEPYVIKYNTISNSLFAVARDYANIHKIEIQEIGEYKAMSEYNPPSSPTSNDGYRQYREESKVPIRRDNPDSEELKLVETWNIVPYDLSFSAGCTILSIMQELINLYPNYEHYFDVFGSYCANMIPSSYKDPIILDYEFINSVLISENTTVNLSDVKNIQMVYGKSFSADWYNDGKNTEDEPPTYSRIGDDWVYTVKYTDYGDTYVNGDVISFICPQTNNENSKFIISGVKDLTPDKNDYIIDIYDENTEKPLAAGKLIKNRIYTFKIKTRYIGEELVTRLYYLGTFQAQSLSALVTNADGMYIDCKTWHPLKDYEPGDYVYYEGNYYKCLLENANKLPSNVIYWSVCNRNKLYDKEYFIEKYGVDNVVLNIIPDSPFAIQNLGEEILNVNTGGDYEKITSDSLAAERSNYELWRSSRLPDNITITTKILPWLDVNTKITYKPCSESEPRQYIIKSISNNWKAGTTEIKMIRFYPLYQDPLIIQN